MKKTQYKDTVRNIKKQSVSFISVVIISMLGIAAFLGLDYSSAAVRKNGSNFFKRSQFRDIEIISTLLLSRDDLEEIRQTAGIADAEAVYMVEAKASSGGDRKNVNVISLTQRINQPELLEGRLPETDSECAAEQTLADAMGWTVGSEILVQSAAGSTAQYLKGERFTLTGIANHPDHGNTLVTDTFYLMVTDEAFDQEALNGCFMKAEIAIERRGVSGVFSKEYKAEASAVRERLETLSATAAPRQDSRMRERYSSQLDEGRRELGEAQAQLAEARRQLDEGWTAYRDGEQQIKDNQLRLNDAQTELSDAWDQLEEARPQLESAEAQLKAGEEQLNEAAKTLQEAKDRLNNAKEQLRSGWNALEDAKAQIRSGIRSAVENKLGDTADLIPWSGRASFDPDSAGVTAAELRITDNLCLNLNTPLSAYVSAVVNLVSDDMLLSAYVILNGSDEGFDAGAERAALAELITSAAGSYGSQYDALSSSCAQWDEGHSEYLQGLAAYNSGYSEYEEGCRNWRGKNMTYQTYLAQYNSGLEAYNEGKAAYEQGLLDLAEGRKTLEESLSELEAGEQEYEAGWNEYRTGAERLEKAQEQFENLAPCRWLVYDMNGNPGYVQIQTAEGSLESIKGTFSLLFILVGALVIYATVSKMVDEQRKLVGTTKALGFYTQEILLKYLSFGVSATVLGGALGMLAARFALEDLVLNGYAPYYFFSLKIPAITALPTVAVMLAGTALAAGAVCAACLRMLRTPAVRLMQAAAPEGAKKTTAGKRKLSLYSRLILLNIRTDIKRVLVTIVSVAGCCALVVVGVTIKTAIIGSAKNQYAGIADYDVCVYYSTEESDTAGTEIEAALRDAGTDYLPIYIANATYSIGTIQAAEIYCADIDALGGFYHLRDWNTGQSIPATDEGVLIQRRVAETFGLDVGSEFELSLGGIKPANVTVAGVFEHFVGRPMVMSAACFEKAYGEVCVPNAFFVRWNGADPEALNEKLHDIRGFDSTKPSDSGKAMFDQVTGVVNLLVLLFIGMAAVMAGVVLLNLTNIYVMQKKRELTIMRVNGFTVKEVVGYMLRETLLTTALGILLGLAVGSGVAYRICRSLEQPFLQLVRDPSIPAWLSGTALTLIFTALVNVVALRPVKNLKLTDISG